MALTQSERYLLDELKIIEQQCSTKKYYNYDTTRI